MPNISPSATEGQPITEHQTRRNPDDFAAEMAARRDDQDELHDATHVDDSSKNAVIERARTAAVRLTSGQTFDDWVAVARAYWIGHCESKRRANKDKGRRYACAFHEWMRQVGLDNVFAAFDKATRARLIDLIEHLDEIRAWRKKLPIDKQLEYNHPRVVWAHWRSAVVRDPNQAPPPSPIAKLKESIAALSKENARLKTANGGNLFTPQDRPIDVVRVLISTFSAHKVAEIRRLLGEKIKQ